MIGSGRKRTKTWWGDGGHGVTPPPTLGLSDTAEPLNHLRKCAQLWVCALLLTVSWGVLVRVLLL